MKLLVLFLTVFIVASLAWAATIVVPKHYSDQVKESLKEKCPACQFDSQNIQINPLNGTAEVKSILFANDPSENTFVKVTVEEIKVWMNVEKLIRYQFEIDHLQIKKIQVLIVEKHHEHEAPANPAQLRELEASYTGKVLEALPPLFIRSVEIDQGSLTYVLKIFGKEAKISVFDINGELSPLSTRGNLGPRYSNATVTARLENSGLVTLNLQADLFSVKNRDHLEIDLQHQPLNQLDPFFFVEDGISFHGDIHRIHAALDVNQGHLTGLLEAAYSGLSFHETETPDQGVIKTVVINILTGFKTAETKPSKGVRPPVAKVNYDRRPGQSVTNFILKGLKPAAFKVIAK